MKQFKIAFCGRSGSGKDTAADYLAMKFRVLCYALASPVKGAVASAFPHIDFSQYGKNDPIPEIGEKSKCELWQTLGTEWGRNMVYENIWVDGLLRRIRCDQECEFTNLRGVNIIVTDVLMKNEVEALRKEGFTIIKIFRPETVLDDRLNDHESESGVDYIGGDVYIRNNGTLEEFQQKVLEVVNGLIG